jgi:hypothetical protein
MLFGRRVQGRLLFNCRRNDLHPIAFASNPDFVEVVSSAVLVKAYARFATGVRRLGWRDGEERNVRSIFESRTLYCLRPRVG